MVLHILAGTEPITKIVSFIPGLLCLKQNVQLPIARNAQFRTVVVSAKMGITLFLMDQSTHANNVLTPTAKLATLRHKTLHSKGVVKYVKLTFLCKLQHKNAKA